MATAGATAGTAAAAADEVAVSEALARLRPRSAPEVVDASVQLVKQAFRPLLVLAAVNAIPGLMLGAVMRRFIPQNGVMPSAGDLASLLGIMAAWMCLSSVGSAAMMRAASDAVLGRTPDVGVAILAALSRAVALILAHLAAYFRAFVIFLGALFVVGITLGVAIAATGRMKPDDMLFDAIAIVGALGAAAAALALITRYIVMTPVIVLERLGARAGLARSTELTAGSRWRLFALMLALYGVTTGASLVSQQLFKALVSSDQLATALNTVLWLPVAPFAACIFTLLYYDLRIRREGYDIELLAGRLTTATPPPTAPTLTPPRPSPPA